MKRSKRNHSPSRRNFLRGCVSAAGVASATTIGFAGSNLLAPKRVAAAPINNHKRLVLINLAGGNDGLNTVIPTGLSRYYDRRPGIGIDANDALSLASGPGNNSYHLHAAMTNSQSMWNDGDMAIVNQVGYPRANLSHFLSQDIWSYGIRGNVSGHGTSLSGWMARYADRFAPTPTGIVSVRSGRPTDFFGGSTNPLMVASLSGFNFVRDWRGGNDHPFRQAIVREVVAEGQWNDAGASASAAAIGQSYDLAGQIQGAIENYTSAVEYENQNPSRGLKDVAMLIQAGFDTSVFYVRHGGYDTHSDQGSRHNTLLSRLDRAIGDFAADMKAMGQWQDTVVVVISEFGRRHQENGSSGTDHGHGNCVLLYGGAVFGGMYGPEHTNEDIDLKYGDYKIDFRTIYRDILGNHLGVDADLVFPEAAEISDSPGGLIV